MNENFKNNENNVWVRSLGWFIDNRLVVGILMVLLLLLGQIVHPFDKIVENLPDDGGTFVQALKSVPRHRVAVDAIPDIGENQQIIFSSWPGRSPRQIEDQVTYPLTTQLLGLPGVKAVRSSSMLGFSNIHVIFNEDVEFYWSRSRILEKLNSLPDGLLPRDVTPALGPDATALGQVYWYTLEGRDPSTGETLGGWSLQELRKIQDWNVRYALQASEGVSEVASIGGYVEEFHVEIDPQKLEIYQIPITKIARAIQESNKDIGARTMEVNRVEYVVRGVGQIDTIKDLGEVVIREQNGTPVLLKDLAHITSGPATRRGALDVGGAQAVGGVVVARYGENPVQVIEKLKENIDNVQQSLPHKVLPDGRTSQVTIVPFYDRSVVVNETLDTLSEALIQQILITILVVVVLLGNLRSSIGISLMLPLSVLGTFVLMKLTGVTANVMSLAGIAIAIGTIVDMGIVISENIIERYDEATSDEERFRILKEATAEVAPAIMTSVLTTILSFLPVFGLTAAEGKLFHPLAFTKTYALCVALVVSLCFLPTLVSWLHLGQPRMTALYARVIPEKCHNYLKIIKNFTVVMALLWLLASAWMPLGAGFSTLKNFIAVAFPSLGLLGLLWLFLKSYKVLLKLALEHKLISMMAPLSVVIFGLTAWLGSDTMLALLPDVIHSTLLDGAENNKNNKNNKKFPGLGEEFMPSFDEGQFLYMPTVMPHASLGQSLEQLQVMDAAIMQIPEVEEAVGKLGRVDSALDPAPISMFETVVTYKSEFRTDEQGNRIRQWRPHIKSTNDIWEEIVKVTRQPGLTGAPKLMPISTRIVMLQSGMRAPMGLQLRGPDLKSLEKAGAVLEDALKHIAIIRPETVFAEKVVGKPYIEIEIHREAIARHGLLIDDVQAAIQFALSGKALTSVIQGRQRIDVVMRYDRGERDSLEKLDQITIPTALGQNIPLEQLADVVYVKGPQVIKSEDTFLTSYITFDYGAGISELEVVEQVQAILEAQRKSGELTLPEHVTYEFAGSYQNQLRSAARLKILVPMALLLIFLVLYMQFKKVSTTVILYAGVVVAISGGMMMLWFYQQPWFLDVVIFEHSIRDVLQVHPINISVAVWVGVIALIGIATDDGVVMATYLDQSFAEQKPESRQEVREAVLTAGLRRVRPCLMTTGTTILALLPVLTSTGRGSDMMLPMAVPILGGMTVELVTLFVVPVLYCAREEVLLARQEKK